MDTEKEIKDFKCVCGNKTNVYFKILASVMISTDGIIYKEKFVCRDCFIKKLELNIN